MSNEKRKAGRRAALGRRRKGRRVANLGVDINRRKSTKRQGSRRDPENERRAD